MTSILEQLFGQKLAQLDSLSPNDPVWQNGKLTESTFTDFVGNLRNPEKCQNTHVNELAALLWRLVGNRVVPASICEIDTMSFWCEAKGGNFFATIMCPLKWPRMVRDDPLMQLGAIVFNASKAKDYWNLLFPGVTCSEKDSTERAYSYEAEFLHYTVRNDPNFFPNRYQQFLLEKFSRGVASVPGLMYEGREFPATLQELLAMGPPFPLGVSAPPES